MTDRAALLAALDWQIELGRPRQSACAGRPLCAGYDAAARRRRPYRPPHRTPPNGRRPRRRRRQCGRGPRNADAAADLPALRDALARFDRCDLKQGARNLVFADGDPAAALMILGEAPGRDEDLQGRPFVGRAGQLLDRMLAAIAATAMPTIPPGASISPMCCPGGRRRTATRTRRDRHAAPLCRPAYRARRSGRAGADGNHACAAMLGRRGITRLRGQWAQAAGRPALPMFHPAYLLRNPAAKREAWADLLALQARLGP